MTILVVGASVAGSITAQILMRRSHAVDVVERSARQSEGRGFGVFLDPTTLEFVQTMTDTPIVGHRITRALVYSPHGELLRQQAVRGFSVSWSQLVYALRVGLGKAARFETSIAPRNLDVLKTDYSQMIVATGANSLAPTSSQIPDSDPHEPLDIHRFSVADSAGFADELLLQDDAIRIQTVHGGHLLTYWVPGLGRYLVAYGRAHEQAHIMKLFRRTVEESDRRQYTKFVSGVRRELAIGRRYAVGDAAATLRPHLAASVGKAVGEAVTLALAIEGVTSFSDWEIATVSRNLDLQSRSVSQGMMLSGFSTGIQPTQLSLGFPWSEYSSLANKCRATVGLA